MLSVVVFSWWNAILAVLLIVAAYNWGGWSIPKRWRKK